MKFISFSGCKVSTQKSLPLFSVALAVSGLFASTSFAETKQHNKNVHSSKYHKLRAHHNDHITYSYVGLGLGASAGIYASEGVGVKGAGISSLVTSSALDSAVVVSPSFNLSARTQLGVHHLAMLNVYGDGPSFNVQQAGGVLHITPFNLGASVKFGTVAKKVGSLAIVPLGGVAVDYISQAETIGFGINRSGNRIENNSLSLTGVVGAQFIITPNSGKQQLTVETTVGAGVQLGNLLNLEKNGQINGAITAGLGLEHRFHISKSAYVGYGIKSDVSVFIASAQEIANNAVRNTLNASAEFASAGLQSYLKELKNLDSAGKDIAFKDAAGKGITADAWLQNQIINTLNDSFNIEQYKTSNPALYTQYTNLATEIKSTVEDLITQKYLRGSAVTMVDVVTAVNQLVVDSGVVTAVNQLVVDSGLESNVLGKNVYFNINPLWNLIPQKLDSLGMAVSNIAEIDAVPYNNQNKDLVNALVQRLFVMNQAALIPQDRLALAGGKLQNISSSDSSNYLESRLLNSNGAEYAANLFSTKVPIDGNMVSLSDAVNALKAELGKPAAEVNLSALQTAKTNLESLLKVFDATASNSSFDDLERNYQSISQKITGAKVSNLMNLNGVRASSIENAGINQFNIDATFKALNYLLANNVTDKDGKVVVNYATKENINAILQAADDVALDSSKITDLTFGLFKTESSGSSTSTDDTAAGALGVLTRITINANLDFAGQVDLSLGSYDQSVIAENYAANLAAIYDTKLINSANKIIAKANSLVTKPTINAESIFDYFTLPSVQSFIATAYATYNLGQDLVDILKDMQKEINGGQDYSLGTASNILNANGRIKDAGLQELNPTYATNHQGNTTISNPLTLEGVTYRNYIREVRDILNKLLGVDFTDTGGFYYNNGQLKPLNLFSFYQTDNIGNNSKLEGIRPVGDIIGAMPSGILSADQKKYQAIQQDVAEINALFTGDSLRAIKDFWSTHSFVDLSTNEGRTDLNTLFSTNPIGNAIELQNQYEGLLIFVDKYIVDLDAAGKTSADSSYVGATNSNALLPRTAEYISIVANAVKEYEDKLFALEEKIADLTNPNDQDLVGSRAQVTTESTTNSGALAGVYTRFYAGFSFGVKF